MIKPVECNLYEQTRKMYKDSAIGRIDALLQERFHTSLNKEVTIFSTECPAFFALSCQERAELQSAYREVGWELTMFLDRIVFYEGGK